MAPVASAAALISGAAAVRHSNATAAAALSAVAACAAHASASLPPTVRINPNAVCSLLQSARPSERNAREVWPILAKKAAQASPPKASHAAAAARSATSAALVAVRQWPPAASAIGNSKPRCGL